MVSMASKGRMGIQVQENNILLSATTKFQWPAKAGWGFRRLSKSLVNTGGVTVSMASKGRMGIQECLLARW